MRRIPGVHERLEKFMTGLIRRNPGEPEFHQAVREVAQCVVPFMEAHPEYLEARILERLTEPDRIITFRVTWQDDDGGIRAARAWRVQFSNAIGPYKGGLRFHPTVTQSVLKFLGFEQILKNSLTGLPMGGAKGGSNFNPRGRSANEVMRFCHAMMRELHRHIGEDTDVPAGDVGVGTREIGLSVRPVHAPRQPLHRGADREGPGLRRQPRAHRGDRLRRGLFPAEHAGDPRRRNRRQDRGRIRLRQRRALRHREVDRAWAPPSSPPRTRTASSTTRTASTPSVWPG